MSDLTTPRPLWVRVGLWKVPTRQAAVAWMWLSVALAAACLVCGLWISYFFFIGVALLGASAWYLCAMRWVDRHGEWRPSAHRN